MHEAVQEIQRPHSKLLLYYVLTSLLFGPLFPVIFVPRYFRYRTLRYDFGDDGISASWGLLFKREIHLTYRRIQDIHVSRNLIERWLGIGKVEIQTAAGRASAELAIEGMEHWGPVRDFLYGRMRGTGSVTTAGDAEPGALAVVGEGTEAEAIALLRGIKDDIERVRQALEGRGAKG